MRALVFLLLILLVPSATASDTNAGEVLAASCRGCHGDLGNVLPSLSQLSPAELEQRLRAFGSGEAPATVMDRIIRGYTEEEIHLLAQTLGRSRASQNSPTAPKSQ